MRQLFEDLSIDFASPVPVYEQIKRQIKQAIARRLLAIDSPLPSIRDLASFLKINPNTVARAYRDLVQENVIGGRAGKGFWVLAAGTAGAEKEKLLAEDFMRFVERAVEMGFSQEEIRRLVFDFFEEAK